jgi:predicted small integral membrane protein
MPKRPATLAACAFSLAAALFAAWHQDWTEDEPYHLYWSERLLDSGVTERVSQDWLNTKTPVSIANVLAGRAARGLGASARRPQRFATRLPTVAWLGLLLGATFLCARELIGDRAAQLVTIGVALDPNLIAHGSLATVDCLYALATLLVLWSALRYARAPAAARAALLGLALGLAFATKFSAVLLALGLLAIPSAAPGGTRARLLRRAPGDALLVALAACAVVALAYLGNGLAQPLGALALRSPLLLGLGQAAPWLRLPLPAAFLEGLDASLVSERAWAPIVLLGKSHAGGVFYYFPVAWALKTPLPFALLLLVGLSRCALSGRLWRDPAQRFLAANLALTLLYFCFFFKTQIGYRFVLMCVPVAWILAAAPLADWRWPRALRAAALVALAENAMYLGNPLSFTNAAVWPKRQVFRLTADSNLDWGQNRDKIQGWLAERGIRASRLDPVHLLPGHNVMSVTNVAGLFDFRRFRWLREHADPTEHLGHTYLRFDVPYETYDAYMDDERTLAPPPLAAELCPAQQAQQPEKQVPFESDNVPAPDSAWLACIDAPQGSDVGYRVVEGMIRIGRVLDDGRCDAELIQNEQVVWYRLAPGGHALCAIEVPPRRKLAPYRTQGTFVFRGRAARLLLVAARLDERGRVARP